MDNQSKPAGKSILPGGVPAWLLCVLFSVVPLALFLLSIETFTPGGVITEGLFSREPWNGKEVFLPAVKAYGSVSFFAYSIYVFAHVLVCIAAGLYFLSRLLESGASRIKFLLFLVVIVFVIAVVFSVTTGNTAFRGYMIDPLSDILTAADVALPKLVAMSGADAFLTLALLVPTSLGIFVVLLATSSFHATLFFPRSTQDENRQDVIGALASVLRQDLIALSIVLVSSVMTSRAYFNIPTKYFLTSGNGAANFYEALAQALSVSTGLLFSATLVATFAPGFVALIAIADGDSGPRQQLSTLWSGLASNLGRELQRFKGIWQSIVALIAPALVAPLMDVLSAIAR